MADAGSLTGATEWNASSGTVTDVQLKVARQGLDGTVANGTSTTGDWGYCSLTASGNTIVKTGSGQIGRLVTTTATGNITIYDGTSASGTVIIATSALLVGNMELNIAFKTGLFIVLSGAGVATVTYR